MTSFVAANPEYEADIRSSFASQGLMATLKGRIESVVPGRVVLVVPFAPGVSQQHGLFHGGVIGALGDNAGGYAALSLMPAGSEVLTVEYKINFMRPARGALLRAVGEVVRSGKSLSVVRVDVEAVDGDARQPCAVLQATMMRVAAVA